MSRILVAAMIVFLLICSAPVQGFSAKTLAIQVLENGDAQVNFSYALSWIENMAIFLKISDPAKLLSDSIVKNFGKEVTVQSVRNDGLTMTIKKLADVKKEQNRTTYNTPEISLKSAEKVLNQYWFAHLINPDFSPSLTTITFPDGYSVSYKEQSTIPAINHVVNNKTIQRLLTTSATVIVNPKH